MKAGAELIKSSLLRPKAPEVSRNLIDFLLGEFEVWHGAGVAHVAMRGTQEGEQRAWLGMASFCDLSERRLRPLTDDMTPRTDFLSKLLAGPNVARLVGRNLDINSDPRGDRKIRKNPTRRVKDLVLSFMKPPCSRRAPP